MKLRILGAHNMESREHRMESHLIDDVLALDAGGLSRALTFREQEGIGALILSHRHFDHVRDLLPLGLARRDSGRVVEVYAIEDTVQFVKDKLLDGSLYPDFLKSPTPENPTFRLNTIEFYREFSVLDYRVIAVPVPHAVPAAGFQISAGGVKLFYTGDTGKGLSRAWDRVSPDVLLTEVTYGNENEDFALQIGHLTPALLEEALMDFRKVHGYLPQVIVAHMNPIWEDAVRREIAELGGRLGIEISISHADMTLELSSAAQGTERVR